MRLSIYAAAACAAVCFGCATRPPALPQAAVDPGMVLVRGGRFTMGRESGDLNERPAHKVDLDAFAIDRTEVEAGDFADFLNAAGNEGERYLTPDDHATVVIVQIDDAAREVRFSARPGYERYPANNVSWNGADAYCRWRGKRLPTEAEWEKAARGADKRLYPWGRRSPRPELARFEQAWHERQLDVLVPVDALPQGASPYGALNMAGNVQEWVGDWYRQNLCDFCNPDGEENLRLVQRLTGEQSWAGGNPPPAVTDPARQAARDGATQTLQAPPRRNPAGPTTGSFKVLRGGSWLDRLDAQLATTRRFWLDPTQRFPTTGFRCAKGSLRDLDAPPAPGAPPSGQGGQP